MYKIIGQIILNYLRFFARLQLAKFHPIIIAVTGSAGKTSCRKAISAILKTDKKVKESVHANSESGISLNILDLKPVDYSIIDWLRLCFLAPVKLLTNWQSYDYYVVEMEADEARWPKNMDYLLTIIKPDIAVYVSTGLVHSQGFDHLITDNNPARRESKLRTIILQENGKLLRHIKEGGAIVYPTDDNLIKDFVKTLGGQKIGVGKSKDSRIKVARTKLTNRGFHVDYEYDNHKYKLTLADALEAKYGVTFGLAISVGLLVGISINKALVALSKTYVAPAGRMRIFKGIKNSHIIDSSYNASPDSMSQALSMLKTIGRNNTTIAVLGDMRELGTLSKKAHQDLADQILKTCDICYLFGEQTGKYTYERLNRQKQVVVKHFTNIKDLIFDLKAQISQSDWILIKGSQNTIFLERVVESILFNSKDARMLCRRGKFWDLKRARAN